MEDQQPAAGSLTDALDGASEDDVTAEADTPETDIAEPGSEAADPEPVSDAAADDQTDGADVAYRTRRPIGRWLTAATVAAAVLFVGSAAFAGATVHQYVADRALIATKLRVAKTAAQAITTLWTYSPENMDKLADRSAQYLSGDFEAEYRKYVDAIVAPNKQAQITNTTQVTGAAVESLNGTDATTLVYTNSTSTSPLTNSIPSLKYLSYRLAMHRNHARWLVTKMTTVTSLDLTPKF